MISYPEAREIFQKYFEEEIKKFNTAENELVISEKVFERPVGWIFSCQSKKFAETEDRKYRLLGSTGILVKRKDGSIIEFGSSPDAVKKRNKLLSKTAFRLQLEDLLEQLINWFRK